MLIFKQDKMVCHLGENREVEALDKSLYRNYAVHFTLWVNGKAKDIRTILGITKEGQYKQDEFTSIINALADIGYFISEKEMTKIYDQIKFSPIKFKNQ